MTGHWPHRHGITANIEDMNAGCHFLQDSPDLLPRRLQSQGYRTGYTGKWHLGNQKDDQRLGKFPVPWPQVESLPRDFGFDGHNFPGHGDGGFEYPEYKEYLQKHGWNHEVANGELTGPVESTESYFLTQNTLSLIDGYTSEEAPFFIWHNFWGPHGPYFATREFNDIYRDMAIPPWPNFCWPARQIDGPHQVMIHPLADKVTWEEFWLPLVRRYYAFTTMIDSQIGRLLDHLDRTGLAATTTVIFAADHGETCGSHGGLINKGYHHFEEIQRIPLIVRGPDVQRGAVRNELISLADFMPTICDLAGAPTACSGRSFTPMLRGESISDWREEVVVSFDGLAHAGCTIRTLRHGPYKYGLNLAHRDQLYDLDADPLETRNLIDHPDYADIADDLRRRIFRWLREADDQALCILRAKAQYYGIQT